MPGQIGRRVLDSVEPLVVRPVVARRMLGSKSTEGLWELINEGELESYLDGHARLITTASIKAYIARKLAAQTAPTTNKPRASKPATPEPRKTRNKSDAASERRITT